jgi:hypothetical protein
VTARKRRYFFVFRNGWRPMSPTLGLIIDACLTHCLHWVLECPKLPTKNKAYKIDARIINVLSRITFASIWSIYNIEIPDFTYIWHKRIISILHYLLRIRQALSLYYFSLIITTDQIYDFNLEFWFAWYLACSLSLFSSYSISRMRTPSWMKCLALTRLSMITSRTETISK